MSTEVTEVTEVIRGYLLQKSPKNKVQMTVRIDEYDSQALGFMADELGTSKASLTRELLVAAIQDAMKALPDKERMEWVMEWESQQQQLE